MELLTDDNKKNFSKERQHLITQTVEKNKDFFFQKIGDKLKDTNLNKIVKVLAKHDLFRNLVIGNYQSIGQLTGIHNNSRDKDVALRDIYKSLR